MEGHVLILVEDEAVEQAAVRAVAQRQGFRVVARAATDDVPRAVREERATAVVLRADEGGRAGRLLRDLPAWCGAVVVSGRVSPNGCGAAVAAGAFPGGSLPIDPGRLARALEDVKAYLARRRSLFASALAGAEQFGCAGMVGRGPAMQAIFERVRRVGPWLRTALIVGEGGTGKQRLARALHALGPRHARPFVIAGAGAHESLDARLFGATGAGGDAHHGDGLLALADGGVIYVAEVAHLSADGQRRLLALVERGARGDLVVLAGATHDPRADAQVGRLDPALLSALSDVEFRLPPLRQRREDIAGLAAVFLREAAARAGRTLVGFSVGAEALLHDARWPGNVAQLRAAIDKACLLADGELLGTREIAASLPPATAEGDEDDNDLPLSSVEREHILRALQRAGGNKKAAARVLGVSRRALYRKLERLDLGATIARRPRDRQTVAADALAAS